MYANINHNRFTVKFSISMHGKVLICFLSILYYRVQNQQQYTVLLQCKKNIIVSPFLYGLFQWGYDTINGKALLIVTVSTPVGINNISDKFNFWLIKGNFSPC